MATETDIKRFAYLMIQKHGAAAAARAQFWAQHFQAQADAESSESWSRIEQRIPELQRLMAGQPRQDG